MLRGREGWGERINYLCKGKLWEKQVSNLEFSQKPPTEFPLFAFNYQHRKQLLKSLPFTAESSSKDLVQLDFREMTGSVSDFNNEDFLLCLVLHAKFLCA